MAQTEGGAKDGKTKSLARPRLQASIFVGQDTEAPPTKATKTFIQEFCEEIFADSPVLLENAAADFHKEVGEAGGKAHIVIETAAASAASEVTICPPQSFRN